MTLGIVVGYVVGKPVGIAGVCWLATRLTGRRLRPPVGWAAVVGGGTIAGIGFTVSLLVASLAFEGETLADAKIGIIAAALIATLLTWLLFSATARLPRRLRIRALAGGAEPLTDLYLDVDPERDHTRGPDDAPVTIVEYGDFECPFCGQAEPVIRELLAGSGDLQYVWRHLPLNDVHLTAQLAAEASEAAADQGAFWEMYDLLLSHQDELQPKDLVRYAEQLGLDVERVHRRSRPARRSRPGRRGRRQRRPQRRLGHADLLHQRPPSLRCLRHRNALVGGAGRAGESVAGQTPREEPMTTTPISAAP